MEYLLVTFPRSRRVKVDGEFNGRTGELIEMEPGNHTISLGPPDNFVPSSRKIRVSANATTSLTPRWVTFDEA
jgi:hypothetical protein